MLFNSVHFLVFFPVVSFLYYLLPQKFRNPMLLLASCYFYMVWRPKYIVFILFTVSVDYVCALLMARSTSPSRRKLFLTISLVTNISLLFVFKYFNFFSNSLSSLATRLGLGHLPLLDLVLPLGISFHTFQAMGYIIDVYRGTMRPERSYFRYVLFVMFFPQLVAGPIERAPNLLKQFYEHHEFSYQNVVDGLKLATWGMLKKVVIADRLGVFVDTVYNSPHGYPGPSLVIATVFFAFQIYCDFSAYSDIAIGVAQMLGFRLMDNFRRPYFSKSISEFWTRWHISLSTWFKDYLYIPMGGSRVSEGRYAFNLLFVFLVSGLWHGAAWTFVIWGALNGAYLITSIWTRDVRKRVAKSVGLLGRPRLHKYVQVGVTFFLTCVAWVFFRAHTLSDALYILRASLSGWGVWFSHVLSHDSTYLARYLFLGGARIDFAIAVGAVFFMELIHGIQRHGSIRHMLRQYPAPVRWSVYLSFVLIILVFGQFGARQFIYFQF